MRPSFRSPSGAILMALAAGIVAGAVCHQAMPNAADVAAALSLLAAVFLRLIQMVIAPLVLVTMAAGVANMGKARAARRAGLKALLWFAGASLVSMGLGLLLADVLRPGEALRGMAQPALQDWPVPDARLTARQMLWQLLPNSIVDSLARNALLQVVVFALFLGSAVSSLGQAAQPLLIVLDSLAQAMLRMTGSIMRFSPLAVFAAVAALVASNGFGVIFTYAVLVAEFYLATMLLWLALLGAGRLALGPAVFDLLRLLKAPVLLAFSTASSEAALPQTLLRLEQFGVPRRLASLVLPLGYSFNLDGSMLYASFATLVVAQAQGIELSAGARLGLMLLLLVTLKGLAGVPRAVLAVMAAALAAFRIPPEGLLLLLGVDPFLDMARSASNVLGNGMATALVARWEGVLHERERAAARARA